MKFEKSFRLVAHSANDWVWAYLKSPEQMKENRIEALHRFLDDYEIGKTQGCYIVGELPKLNLDAGQFDIAICSHLLFLYADHFSYEIHLE